MPTIKFLLLCAFIVLFLLTGTSLGSLFFSTNYTNQTTSLSLDEIDVKVHHSRPTSAGCSGCPTNDSLSHPTPAGCRDCPTGNFTWWLWWFWCWWRPFQYKQRSLILMYMLLSLESSHAINPSQARTAIFRPIPGAWRPFFSFKGVRQKLSPITWLDHMIENLVTWLAQSRLSSNHVMWYKGLVK